MEKEKATSGIAFTQAVKAAQERRGSRANYARMEAKGGFHKKITADLVRFIRERDSFYLATADKEGQPYIQHRGGPRGFLKVLDEHTLGFADYTGNKQYLTVGTLSENDKAFIFLMDYPNRRRIKIWGKARVVENYPELLDRLRDPDYPAVIERAILFEVQAWDINCPLHIVPRYTEEEIASIVDPLKERIARVEAENAELRERLAANIWQLDYFGESIGLLEGNEM